jgi:hypothetical protein
LNMPDSNRITHKSSLIWTPEAESLIDKVPSFAQVMARKMVENSVLEKNESVVKEVHVQEIGQALGMNEKKSKENSKLNNDPYDIAEAEVVVLKKIKRMAPNFHQHIVKSKIQGNVVSSGDKILVYEVLETVPPQKVRVTENTILEFR